MSVQLDTNIVVRLFQTSNSLNPIVSGALDALRAAGREPYIVPQNLYEYWAVATRPIDQNGLGLSIDEASHELNELKRAFVLFPDTGDILGEWERLVVLHQCKGKQAHDARIVAAMNVHGVKELLTFNLQDFARYTDITVLDPAAVAAGKA